MTSIHDILNFNVFISSIFEVNPNSSVCNRELKIDQTHEIEPQFNSADILTNLQSNWVHKIEEVSENGNICKIKVQTIKILYIFSIKIILREIMPCFVRKNSSIKPFSMYAATGKKILFFQKASMRKKKH